MPALPLSAAVTAPVEVPADKNSVLLSVSVNNQGSHPVLLDRVEACLLEGASVLRSSSLQLDVELPSGGLAVFSLALPLKLSAGELDAVRLVRSSRRGGVLGAARMLGVASGWRDFTVDVVVAAGPHLLPAVTRLHVRGLPAASVQL